MADEMDLRNCPDNFFSLYNRPFIINDQWREMDLLVWAQSLPHIPAVLYFNAGLCHHRMAVQQNSTVNYKLALQMYHTTAMLLENNAANGCYLTELDILLLASTNNAGHIFSHFVRVDDSFGCLKRMLAVFFLSECKSLMTKDEYVFFYINILLFVNRWPILAGAA